MSGGWLSRWRSASALGALLTSALPGTGPCSGLDLLVLVSHLRARQVGQCISGALDRCAVYRRCCLGAGFIYSRYHHMLWEGALYTVGAE